MPDTAFKLTNKICEALNLPANRITKIRIDIDAGLPHIYVTMIDLDGKLADLDWSEVKCGDLNVWVEDANKKDLH